jgi:hypothetical protein
MRLKPELWLRNAWRNSNTQAASIAAMSYLNPVILREEFAREAGKFVVEGSLSANQNPESVTTSHASQSLTDF